MRPVPGIVIYIFLALILTLPIRGIAQDSGVQTPSPNAPPLVRIPEYPDSTSGLEHLAKDILKAQKESNRALADELLKNLVLSDYERWPTEPQNTGAARP